MQVTVQTPSKRKAAPKATMAGQGARGEKGRRTCAQGHQACRGQTGACSGGQTRGHLPMGISSSWMTNIPHFGVSWEVFHMCWMWQGTPVGLDAAVGSPKVELEHLFHQEHRGHRAPVVETTLVNLLRFQGQLFCFGVTAYPARHPAPFLVSCMTLGSL